MVSNAFIADIIGGITINTVIDTTVEHTDVVVKGIVGLALGADVRRRA